MKLFFLVFEDLLDSTQKSVAGPFSAQSQEDLALRFGLQKRTPRGCSPTYWTGKSESDDVVVYITLLREHHLGTLQDLQKVAHQLHCDWY